ncbi:MAG: hypothetical protein LBO68_04825, partial [Synergistaceae bacterium]|nr:hypothetical protein [Synergistaceae bacterium]
MFRALKGLAFSHAALGDSSKMEEALSRLGEKNPEEAESVRADAAIIMETYRKAEASAEKTEKVEDDDLSNAMERQADAAERAASERKSPEAGKNDAEEDDKEGFASIWGLKLGASIEEAIASLKSQGINAIELEETTALGSRFYVTKLPNERPLRDWVDKEVGASFHILEEYRGKLLTVSVVCNWKRNRGSIAFKDEVFDSVATVLGQEYGHYVDIEGNKLYTEALWISEWTRLVVLDATVSLDGQ